jgi:DNA-directed RNA polymerase subunit RPC12/RpoP
MKDIEIVCKECGNKFLFTVKEQEFYKEKGFNTKPTRCNVCRKRIKEERNENRRFNEKN